MKRKEILKQLNIELNALPVPDVLSAVRVKSQIIVTHKVQPEKASVKQKVQTRKLAPRLVASVLSVILLVFGAIGGIFAFIPTGTVYAYSTVTLDINPSLEIIVDKDENVLAVNGINDDAATLLQGLSLTGLKYYNAIQTILAEAISKGYINAGAQSAIENAVMFAVRGANSTIKNKYINRIKQTTTAYLTNNAVECNVIEEEYADGVEDEIEALEATFTEGTKVSAAKYAYIKRIIARLPELAGQEENLANMSVAELYKLLNENTSEFATGNDLIQDIIDGILDTWRAGNSGNPNIGGATGTITTLGYSY
ncbi:MAG: hypothetical protein AB7S44_02170 [Spirochaetales bacterium]